MPLLRTLLVLLLLAPVALADDWPQWRGPRRDGVSTETGLLKEWPKDGPPLAWEAKGVGRGYSSVAVSAGKVYTVGDTPTTEKDKDEYLTCLNEADGKPVWKVKLGTPYKHPNKQWESSRSTPTIDGELLYVLTGNGDLICLQTADGKERWRKNMQKDFGGKKGDDWGYSESPLIDGDNVVCTPGGKTTMAALDKKTGETRWTATVPGDKPPGAGHASIIPTEIGKTRVYVQTTQGFGLGVRATDGKVLWTLPDFTSTAVIPTPVVRGDLVLFAAGYKTGGTLLRQVPDGDDVRKEEVYPLTKTVANKHGGIVLVGDYLYGDTQDSGIPFCVEFMTGKEKWKHRIGGASASMIAAEGFLYIHSADGKVRLVKADPADYQEVSSFKTPGAGGRPNWAHPAIANGKLYVREEDSLYCYDVKAK